MKVLQKNDSVESQSVTPSQKDKIYDGIGMGVFAPFAAVDIDGCVVDGKLSELAEDIIKRLDSYTEYSPSGNGIRIICKVCDLSYSKDKYYVNNRKIGLEVYIPSYTNRFVTLTGNVIRKKDVEFRDAELQDILDCYMKRTHNFSVPQQTESKSYLSDESVLSKARLSKQASKFERLWHGDISEYSSSSEADLALCSMLAFWCGGDMEQMDRLFRQSGLMREKWERENYRSSTLNRAVQSCLSFYQPVRQVPAIDDFNEGLQTIIQLNPLENPRYRFGDISFGRLFADVSQGVARYVPERKHWFVYDGRRWGADIGALKTMELCKELADNLLLYALTITDESRRNSFLEQCRKWQQRRFRETYLKEAQSVYPVSYHEFDRDRYLLNCQNGTLNLQTMVFQKHQASDYLTKMAAVDYRPELRYERFERYISEIMSDDAEKARFLQKALGYAVAGDTRHECMFFLYGETTRNGKGTLMESILKVMGDYGIAVRPETIAQQRSTSSHSPSEDIARLAGIRLANISEPGKGLLLNAAQVKSMTGNDTLNARFLHENSFDFQPQFKIYINTNYLPVINDMTLFSSGRVLIIPFDRQFQAWEQDKSLKEQFKSPQAQSAILNWLLQGYVYLRKEGLQPPASVLDATQEYAHESNKVMQFLEERLVEDPNAETRTAAVYDAYRAWCFENGCFCENSRNFNHELRKIAHVVRKRPVEGGNKTTLLKGYRLNSGTDFLV